MGATVGIDYEKSHHLQQNLGENFNSERYQTELVPNWRTVRSYVAVNSQTLENKGGKTKIDKSFRLVGVK